MQDEKHTTPATPMSVGLALFTYHGANPKDAQLVRTVIKKLFPDTQDLGPGAFQTFANSLNHEVLASMLEGAAWTAAAESALVARGCPQDRSHLKLYPAGLRRFVDFTERLAQAMAPSDGMLPEWRDFLHQAFSLLPAGKAELRAYAAAGSSSVIGRYPIDENTLDKVASQMNNIRSAMRRLARQASRDGLSPRDFAECVLVGERRDRLGDYATQTIYASYCRHLWNAAVIAFPANDLPLWADRRSCTGIPMPKWPAPLRDGITAALFEGPNASGLRDGTVKSYKSQLAGTVGILVRAGFDLERLTADLTPQDAVRLLLAGWPRFLLSGDPERDSAIEIYRRLLSDAEYMKAVLAFTAAVSWTPPAACLDPRLLGLNTASLRALRHEQVAFVQRLPIGASWCATAA